jgi:hypothetical protein
LTAFLDELQRGESAALELLRADVLAEIDADPDDCRLSRAEPSQMVEVLNRKGFVAVLLTISLEEYDPSDLMGVQFTTWFSDGMTREEMENVIASASLTNWKRKGIDLMAAMQNASALVQTTNEALEQIKNERCGSGRRPAGIVQLKEQQDRWAAGMANLETNILGVVPLVQDPWTAGIANLDRQRRRNSSLKGGVGQQSHRTESGGSEGS